MHSTYIVSGSAALRAFLGKDFTSEPSDLPERKLPASAKPIPAADMEETWENHTCLVKCRMRVHKQPDTTTAAWAGPECVGAQPPQPRQGDTI